MKTSTWMLALVIALPLLAPPFWGQSSSNLPASGQISKGSITVNGVNYRSIQDAIDGAESNGGGTVLLSSGTFVARQIVLRTGVSLVGTGMNLPPHGSGTILQQEPGANTDFIVSDSHLTPVEYMHWSVISNLAVLGNSENSKGSGIRFNSRTGEGLKFEHLFVRGFAESGISISRGAVPFYGEDLHLFKNGSYGIDIGRTSHDINQVVQLSLVSGDDNGTALVHIGPSGGVNSGETYIISGVKAEKHTPGKQNVAILLESMNGSPVVIEGVGATNTSHEKADSIVRVAGSSARLSYMGLSHDAGYVYSINDTVTHRQLPQSTAGFYDADLFQARIHDGGESPTAENAWRHQRVPVCKTDEKNSCNTHVTWTHPFTDSDYTPTCSLEASDASPRFIVIAERLPESITVTTTGGTKAVTLDCIAIHD